MKCFVLLAVVTLARGGVIPAVVDVAPAAQVVSAPAAVVETGVSSQFRSQDDGGNYAFGYDESHTSGGTFRRESGDSQGNVVGSYGLKDADGRQRIVNYVADAGGFRANVQTNEPGVEPKDPADVKINKPEEVHVDEPAVVVSEPVVAVKETPVAVVEPLQLHHADQVVVAEKPTTVKVEAPAAVTYTTVQKQPVAISTVADVHHPTSYQVIPNLHHSTIPAVHYSAPLEAAAVPNTIHSPYNIHYTGAPHGIHYISPFSTAYAIAAANLTGISHKVATTDTHHAPVVTYSLKPTVLNGSPFAYYPHFAY